MNNLLMALAITISTSVLDFLPLVERVEEVDDATLLTLIHMESTGRLHLWSPSGNHAGPLQIGQAYLDDAQEYAGREGLIVEDLLDNSQLSIHVFMWYMRRYQSVHNWEPELVAMVHKAGAPMMMKVVGLVTGGLSLEEAIDEVGVPGGLEYLRRFRKFRKLYEEALEFGC